MIDEVTVPTIEKTKKMLIVLHRRKKNEQNAKNVVDITTEILAKTTNTNVIHITSSSETKTLTMKMLFLQ